MNSFTACDRPLGFDMAQYYDIICSSRKFVELSEDDGNDWEGIVCPTHPGHQRAGRRITLLHLDVVSKRICDFSQTILADVVITDHALDVLRSAGLTGFTTAPTILHKLPKGMDPDSVPTLRELIVTGQGGYAHPDSEIVLRKKCDDCGHIRYSAYEHGIIVDETAYDGSDLFTVVEYPKHILVNERAKRVIEDARLTNVTFIESSKLVWPEGVIKP